jgi:hypothetical protein
VRPAGARRTAVRPGRPDGGVIIDLSGMQAVRAAPDGRAVGNFGIVTAYHFTALPSPPGQVLLATTSWPWSRLTEASFGALLRNYGQFLHPHSAPSSRFAGLFSLAHPVLQGQLPGAAGGQGPLGPAQRVQPRAVHHPDGISGLMDRAGRQVRAGRSRAASSGR